MQRIAIITLTVCLGGLLMTCSGCPGKDRSYPELEKADGLFDDGLFQEALDAYAAVESEKPEVSFRVFYRSVECLTHLYRYGEAAQELVEADLPEDEDRRARQLVLQAEVLQSFLMQYSWVQSNEVIDDPGDGDVFHMTPDEVKAEIRGAYGSLWDMREHLEQMPIEDEGYFLAVDGVDRGAWPTMYDFLIYSWTEYLVQVEASQVDEQTVIPEGDPLLVADWDRDVSLDDPPALLAAALMEAASRDREKKHREAGERWRVRRLVLALSAGYFGIEDPEAARDDAIAVFEGWFDEFGTKGGKADAGYQAAVLMEAKEDYVAAVSMCEKVQKKGKKTYAAWQARLLEASIREPEIQLTAEPALPPAKEALTLRTRNLEEVHFRIDPMDPQVLREEIGDYSYGFYGWSSLLGYPNGEWLEKKQLKRKPWKKWTSDIADKGDFQWVETTVEHPELEAGLYLVVASEDPAFKVGKKIVTGGFLNVTDLVLVGTPGTTTKTRDGYHAFLDGGPASQVQDELLRYYALDARTGEPVEGADLAVWTSYGAQGMTEEHDSDLETAEHGVAVHEGTIHVQPAPPPDEGYSYSYDAYRYTTSWSFDPLATRGDSRAYWQSSNNLSYVPPVPVTAFVELDRPIYRPGHEVQARAVVVRRTPSGFRAVGKGRQTDFIARDANGEEFFRETVETTAHGSASVVFEIPRGRMLGSFSLEVRCDDPAGTGVTTTHFSVEEYKRPEFEVTLEPAEKPWKYGEPVTVTGKVRYYFGGPVPDARVSYSISRSMWIPWYYRYWFGSSLDGSSAEIDTGEIRTDADGNFTIELTPEAPPRLPWQEKAPDIASFTIDAEARDAGGRTIATTSVYKAGASALYFVNQPDRGFFRSGEAGTVTSTLYTINDTPAPASASWEVFALSDEPARPLDDMEGAWYWSGWTSRPPLDVQLAEVPSADRVGSGTAQHGDDGVALVTLPALEPGVYRLVTTTSDPWGGEVKQESVFVVAGEPGEAVPVRAASVTLVERDAYEVGETARLVVGSDLGAGIYHMEVLAGGHFLDHEMLEKGPTVRVVEVPVTKDMKGGFSARWFGVRDMQVHHGQADVAVPWSEKRITVSLDPFQDVMKPGEEVTWGLKLADAKGKPVAGEALALMYDRSLEYYAASYNPWLGGLYAPSPLPGSGMDSVFDASVTDFWIEESILDKIKEALGTEPSPPLPPGLRTWETWAGGRPQGLFGRFRAKGEDQMMLSEGIVEEAEMAPAAAPAPGGEKAVARKAKKADTGAAGDALERLEGRAGQVETREAFADTAFFLPHLTTGASGSAKLSFTAPDQLTGWRIKVFAHTGDVMEGVLSSEAVTRKELMVRADLPRFFREKDEGTITAIVHNESEEPMEGDLLLQVLAEDGTSVAASIGIGEPAKRFVVEPHGLQSFDWSVTVPDGVGRWTVRVTVMSGDLTDAESRELPILPSRQRIIESVFVALHGTETETLSFDLPDDPTRENESMVLQVDPQLALSLLNTIPFLIEYPYECTEQILNKYVPLAIVGELYSDYPAIRAAAAKIPDRDTVTPAWEQDDPRRLVELMETPWVRESKGYSTDRPLIELIDPVAVEKRKTQSLDQLRAAQLPGGAFPWWPGGRADPYITLVVLHGFAEARRHEVEVPHDMIDAALGYLNREIPSRLHKDERNLALVAYASYVLTSYPTDEFPEAKKGHELAKKWVKFLEKHRKALTPFGKAYLAYVHHRLGNEERAQEVLDMAMDGAREDPLVGVYFQPEKYAWVWYSDSIEKHAFLLRTLQELRPDDERIPGMVQWLLFNRKGNVWKSTKASAAAVFALLDYLEKVGALDSNEVFHIAWGDVDTTVTVKPDDWLDEPLRWIEEGTEITDGMTKAVVEKKGEGPAFASMTWIYSTDQLPEASAPGLLEVERTFYRRVKKQDAYHLEPIGSGDTVAVGDEVVIRLVITSKSQFEYMHLMDPKAAGFEAETLLSGWKWDPLSYYEEPRDSLTNFFLDWLPQGEYIVDYTLRPTKPGTYRVGAATLQSMYAPEMTAHSAGFILEVTPDTD